MSRPFKCRQIGWIPEFTHFKPTGIPTKLLEEINLTLDEIEAVRLADFKGLYQEKAAEGMGISRQTFANILTQAHQKIADSIINGKALKIEGGVCKMSGRRIFKCMACEKEWEMHYGAGRPNQCPECGSKDFHRAQQDRGYNRNQAGLGRRRCGRWIP